MRTGMLWLDTDKRRSLEEKVLRAAVYYEEKYGNKPEICWVNKGALAEEKEVAAIQIRPVPNITVHHFWLGMETS